MTVGKLADPTLTLESLLKRSEIVTAGLDGGGLDDLFGAAVIGREIAAGADERFYSGSPVAQRWLHWGHAWCHVGVLERRKEIAPKLLDFAADGDLTIIERVGDDVAQAVDFIEQIRDSGLFPEKGAIGVDPAGIGAVLDELGQRGFDVTPETGFVVGIPQGWKLTSAIKTIERKLAGGEFAHGGSRMMAWCLGNAKVEPRGNAILITKQASGVAKIDPLSALFNAGALMGLNPKIGGIGEGIRIIDCA